MVKKLLGTWFVQLFCITWAAFLFIDYLNYSGYLIEGFKYLKYSDLIFTVAVLCVATAYLFSNRKKIGLQLEIQNFRGIYHYLFVLLLMVVIMFFYLNKMDISQSPASSSFAFLFRTLAFHLGLGFILFTSLSVGMFVLEQLPYSFEKSSSALISLSLGFFLITMLLFLLGALGLLHQFILVPLFILLLIPGWKKSLVVLKEILFKKSVPFKIHFLTIFAYGFMIFLVAITLISNTRTFPIGFDGLSLYMNVPKLIAGYHGLTQGGDAYNWSLFMSTGFILFNTPTIAILLSITPGILCLIAIFRICKDLDLNVNWSIFSCALFYSLPNTIWLSRFEEKNDLALLFITLCSILLFSGKTNTKNQKSSLSRLGNFLKKHSDFILWAFCGCLIGFTFGIKYVSMINIFAFLVVLFFTNSGKYGAIAVFFFNLAIIFGLDLTRFAAFERDLMFYRFIVPFALGIVALIFAFKNNRQGLFVASKKAVVYLIAIGFTFLPWAIKNSVENKSISIENMLTGKSPLPDLYPRVAKNTGDNSTPEKNKNTYPELLKVNYSSFGFSDLLEKFSPPIVVLNNSASLNETVSPQTTSANSSTNNEKNEEIRRYLGYESGIIRFLSLPYDIVMKTNVNMVTSETGILFLILIPIFIFVFSFRQLPWNIIKMILLLFVLVVSLISVQLLKGPINYESALESLKGKGFTDPSFFKDLLLPVYVFLKQLLVRFEIILMPVYSYLTIQSLGLCFILVSLFSIPIYFIFKNSFSSLGVVSKSTIAFVYCIVQYWLILSSGIVYYGLVGFSLIPVIIALLANNAEKKESSGRFIKNYIMACTAIWFIIILPFQLIPQKFLFVKELNKINFNEFIDVQSVKYAIGEYDEREALKQFFPPALQNIIKTLNRDKNAKVINVSTPLNYYLINNDSRVYKDNQLGLFKGIYTNVNNDRTLLAKEFKRINVKYVLVNFKTPELDQTPDKSLTKKFDELMIAIVNNPEFRLLYTNRLVERPDGDLDIKNQGQIIKAKYEIVGKSVIDPGTDALFEIL